jgi:hypothetical protein
LIGRVSVIALLNPRTLSAHQVFELFEKCKKLRDKQKDKKADEKLSKACPQKLEYRRKKQKYPKVPKADVLVC